MTYDDPADPAREAMARPEPLDPREPVYAVGIGPGDPAYLTPIGRRRIADADVVLGFQTVVRWVRSIVEGEPLACSYDDEETTVERFAEAVGEGRAGTVVMAGDPNVSGYQFLGKVERAIDRPVRVVPGVSSVQVAASRARTPMEESTIVTLHKSGPIEADLDRLVRAAGDRHLLVFPRPFDWMPCDVAAHLVEAGADETCSALVFQRLTLADESVTHKTLGELADLAGRYGRNEAPFSDLSILVVRRRPGP